MPDTRFDLHTCPFLTPSGTLCHLPRKRGRDVRVCDAPSPFTGRAGVGSKRRKLDLYHVAVFQKLSWNYKVKIGKELKMPVLFSVEKRTKKDFKWLF
jgi:hypothetical protein